RRDKDGAPPKIIPRRDFLSSRISLTWFSDYAISGYRVLCKSQAFITCLFAVGLCKSFLMEGVSNHDRTIGEDGFAIRGRGAGRKERPNTKRTGELAEASFLHKAVGLGLNGT